jgi:hypothetical protein
MADDEWNPEPDVSNELLDRLPPEILETFTPDQRAALWGAARPSTWRAHPVDIRLSIPLGIGNLFFAVVSGVERRTRGRVKRDTRTHPFLTPANLIFLVVLFAIAVGLGSVLTEALDWITAQIDALTPSAKGIVAPK